MNKNANEMSKKAHKITKNAPKNHRKCHCNEHLMNKMNKD